MKHYLATTAIQEIWDKENDLLLLGPWCLSGKNDDQVKDYTFIPSPWKPTIKIKEAGDYCHQVYLEILPKIATQLNKIHGASYPLRYWEVLLSSWLLPFIGLIYDRYMMMDMAIKTFPDLYTHALAQEYCDLSSLDAFDCLAGKAQDDVYNLRLFSVINQEIWPQSIIETKLSSVPKNRINEFSHSWKAKIFNYFTKSFFSKGSVMLVDMYHLSSLDKLALKCKSGFRKIGFIDYTEENKVLLKDLPLNDKLRQNINLGQDQDKFCSLLYKIMPSAIPRCYIEGYEIYSKYVDTIKSIDKVKVIGTATGWHFNEILKFLGAKLALDNVKLIEFQHGGGYNNYLFTEAETLSLQKDIFYIWGMDSRKQAKKTRYLPSSHLSKIKDSYTKKNDRILFISAWIPRFRFRCITCLQPEDGPKYLKDEILFLDFLDENVKNKIWYRTYQNQVESRMDFMRQYYPGINFLANGRLIEWMQKVNMVIIDNASTTILEALAINVPCIFYWDHDVYLMRDEAEGYFELLRRVGILYKDPVSAAKKVNKVFNNSIDWWLSSDIQNARQEFCQRYAYGRKDWQKIWVKELCDITKPALVGEAKKLTV